MALSSAMSSAAREVLSCEFQSHQLTLAASNTYSRKHHGAPVQRRQRRPGAHACSSSATDPSCTPGLDHVAWNSNRPGLSPAILTCWAAPIRRSPWEPTRSCTVATTVRLSRVQRGGCRRFRHCARRHQQQQLSVHVHQQIRSPSRRAAPITWTFTRQGTLLTNDQIVVSNLVTYLKHRCRSKPTARRPVVLGDSFKLFQCQHVLTKATSPRLPTTAARPGRSIPPPALPP